jgi:septal ring factor EnvC (AmiA/AmiB activator)
MPKYMLFLMLCLLWTISYADELDDKMRQLREVQKQLENTQQKVKQTETKKKQAETDIQRTSSLNRRTEDNLRKLRSEELVIRDSLRSVQQRLENAESGLKAMHRAQNAELDMLLRVDRSYRQQGIKHRDHRLLNSFITGSRKKIDILSGYRVALTFERELHQSKAVKVTRGVKEESTKNVQYDKKIKTLATQTKQLTQEQKTLQVQVEKLKKDSASLEGLVNQLMAKQGKTPSSYQFTGKKIAWPLRGAIIRGYGEETKSYGTSVVNNGIDIAAAEGTKVVAADDGEVIFSDRYGGQGKLIIIDHKNGFFTLYAYNSELLAAKGTKVKRGQTIAKSGMTGSASQASLHFELRKDGKAINPIPYLE